MKKIICWIFGHFPFTYNKGTQDNPEQAWACKYCNKDLTQGDEFWGLNLNSNITKCLFNLKKDKETEIELPF